MEQVFVCVVLAVVGAALGSFAGAQVWRMRARQLADDKKAKRDYDEAEYARLKPLLQKGVDDRSIDLDTGKRLAWYDMIPVLSWLALRGRSRYSGKFIGWFELVIELAMAAFFVGSYLLWPFGLEAPAEIARFILWLVAGVVLAIQFASDYKWQLLWTWLNYALIGIGFLSALIAIAIAPSPLAALGSVGGSVAILGGLYFVLYAVSRERWVGFGDVLLGLGLGLLLADWVLAFVALFAANLIGTLIVLVGFATKTIKRKQHVPFGPLLIAGAVIAQLFGHAIVAWYLSLFLA